MENNEKIAQLSSHVVSCVRHTFPSRSSQIYYEQMNFRNGPNIRYSEKISFLDWDANTDRQIEKPMLYSLRHSSDTVKASKYVMLLSGSIHMKWSTEGCLTILSIFFIF